MLKFRKGSKYFFFLRTQFFSVPGKPSENRAVAGLQFFCFTSVCTCALWKHTSMSDEQLEFDAPLFLDDKSVCLDRLVDGTRQEVIEKFKTAGKKSGVIFAVRSHGSKNTVILQCVQGRSSRAAEEGYIAPAQRKSFTNRAPTDDFTCSASVELRREVESRQWRVTYLWNRHCFHMRHDSRFMQGKVNPSEREKIRRHTKLVGSKGAALLANEEAEVGFFTTQTVANAVQANTLHDAASVISRLQGDRHIIGLAIGKEVGTGTRVIIPLSKNNAETVYTPTESALRHPLTTQCAA